MNNKKPTIRGAKRNVKQFYKTNVADILHVTNLKTCVAMRQTCENESNLLQFAANRK